MLMLAGHTLKGVQDRQKINEIKEGVPLEIRRLSSQYR